MEVDNAEIKLKESIVNIVADIIRKNIINGKIKHNSKLSTRQLSEELGISRTPVREAIRRLEGEGLIELLPRRGFISKEYTIDKIKEIYEVRKIMEIKAIKLACKNITIRELDRIKEVNLRLDSALQDEKSDILNIKQLNEEFHFEIYSASHNATLFQIIRNLWFRISGMFFVIFSISDRSKTTPKEHGEILNALEKSDEKKAKRALEKHLKLNEEILLAYKKFSKDKKD